MNELMTRTPEIIAAEINGIKDQQRKMMIVAAIEIGRRLTEVKGMLEHGQWGDWLEKSVDYSQRTANDLMRIFEEYGENQLLIFDNSPNSQALANLSYTQAVLMLRVAAEERETFIEENDVPNMSTRDLEQAIKGKQEAEKKLQDANDANSTLHNTLEDMRKTLKSWKDKAEKLEEDIKREKATENPQSISELVKDLARAQETVRELTEELKAKPIETTVVEKVPEEVEREIDRLRAAATMDESPLMVTFRLRFEALAKSSNEMFDTLIKLRDVDAVVFEKYSGAIYKFLENALNNLNIMTPAADIKAD